MIVKPSDIVYHIIGVELDNPDLSVDSDGLTDARNAHPEWQMGFAVNKKINSKKLIEGIAKESKLFPLFKGDKLSFNSILDTYDSVDFEIQDSDVISYKFDRTKIEEIKTKVILNYHHDYATDDFTKSTESNDQADTAEEVFLNDPDDDTKNYKNSYYGIEGEQGDDPIEVKYIRHDETAVKLQRFLLAWYCNQHNTCKVRLPLSYLYAEVGDIVAFPKLLNGRKAYGEDYSLEGLSVYGATVRNGQEIFTYWMVMGVSKTLEYVELDLIQLHNLTTTLTNIAPTADFVFQNTGGETITASLEGEEITLNPHPNGEGSTDTGNSYDPEGSELSYLWTPPESITLSGWELNDEGTPVDMENNAQSPTFTAPNLSDSDTESHEFKLIVTADEADSLETPHSLTVMPPPNAITVAFLEGWNIVGLSIETEANSLSDIFPDATAGTLYGYPYIEGQGSYTATDTLEPKKGYWVRFPEAGTTTIGGTLITNFTISLNQGWNLFSGISAVTNVSGISDPGGIIVSGTCYGFNETYVNASVLTPGMGYWVNASADGDITISSGG